VKVDNNILVLILYIAKSLVHVSLLLIKIVYEGKISPSFYSFIYY